MKKNQFLEKVLALQTEKRRKVQKSKIKSMHSILGLLGMFFANYQMSNESIKKESKLGGVFEKRPRSKGTEQEGILTY
jgi:hypothetical protein